MKNINFNTTIVNLEGITMKQGQNDLLIKDIVANTMCVAKAKTGEAVRQLNLALEIYKSKESITLEDVDVKFIKDILSTADLSTLILGQIIKLLDVPETK